MVSVLVLGRQNSVDVALGMFSSAICNTHNLII